MNEALVDKVAKQMEALAYSVYMKNRLDYDGTDYESFVVGFALGVIEVFKDPNVSLKNLKESVEDTDS